MMELCESCGMVNHIWLKPTESCTFNKCLEFGGMRQKKLGWREIRKQTLEHSASSNSEQDGDYGSLRGQHVDTVPRLILHL